ncbi:thiamine pyrophosphate-dependent enzyme [uncultured Bradyrhizobium sp.]|jgi:thiamine pyrophosphate-dependent acetolactate synthase large subunit-like protein|uniref:thiamine pyrophosphate-dependent enzyme n=1 Tax=uncultured Bradyrhizobium sp. TaxID=199684 RepID=UPI00260B2776|nr:thiamine pyrophosphate-dependent enzyme [uncultured Bradyrhizobium sp.]
MNKANLLDRRKVVSALLVDRKDVVAIGGLGASTNDITAVGDHARNFYLWGGMGGAAMIGLGLALAQPKLPVLVITGDGEMLMGMGSLATIGLQKPSNLSIVVLDNEAYGETGGQTSHTSAAADLVGVAKACGIADSRAVTTMAEVEAFAKTVHDLSTGPRFANVKIDSAGVERILPSRDGTYIVNRIRGDLGFQPI